MTRSITRRALIIGITGENGTALAELLLDKGHAVHGVVLRDRQEPARRGAQTRGPPLIGTDRVRLHDGDIANSASLTRILAQVAPDEIYDLSAQSRLVTGLDTPEAAADAAATGALRLLEAIRFLKLIGRTRLYQTVTSGLARPAEERSPRPTRPGQPGPASRPDARTLCVEYREAYGLHACNGILPHGAPQHRGASSVARRITRTLANIAQGLETCLHMGDLDSLHDWGHARDLARLQWLMLQQDRPEDYLLATAVQLRPRDVIVWAAEDLGMALSFRGTGAREVAVVSAVTGDKAPAVTPGDVVMRIDPPRLGAAGSDTVCSDLSKARRHLGWEPVISPRVLCAEMVAQDLQRARSTARLKARKG